MFNLIGFIERKQQKCDFALKRNDVRRTNSYTVLKKKDSLQLSPWKNLIFINLSAVAQVLSLSLFLFLTFVPLQSSSDRSPKFDHCFIVDLRSFFSTCRWLFFPFLLIGNYGLCSRGFDYVEESTRRDSSARISDIDMVPLREMWI